MSPRTVACQIARQLQAAGFPTYFVGGCVRDALRGVDPHDFDLATAATPEHIEHLFPHTVPVGRAFGVVLVVASGFTFQVATFRKETGYADGRHPSHVEFCDAPADARRRDFTVNGLFWDPVTDTLHDWVGGEADLRAGLLRTIGPPADRFAEDHLRLLRAVRFAAQLNFSLEPATFAAVQSHASLIRTVSAERVRDELLKLFRPPHAARGLDLLRDSGLLAQVLPEIATLITCQQSPEYHPEGTVYNHVRKILEHLPADADPALPWAALLHDLAKPATASTDPTTGQIHFYGHEKVGATLAEAILQRLKFPRRLTEDIVACVLLHMQFKDVRQMRKATLRRLLLRPTFPLELALHRLDCLGSHGRLEHYDFLVAAAAELQAQPALRPPLLTGTDLLALGMKPGPQMGVLLAHLREKQLADELTTAEEARAWARAALAEAGA